MTTQTVRGRRRATGPAPEPRPAAAVVTAERPRDAHRDERRGRRSAFRQMTDFAAVSGVGQKAGIALAATGLVLTISVPATGPVMANDAAKTGSVSAAAQPEVKASAAQIDFNRTAITTKGDPDGKLKQLLSAQSASTITRAASAGSLGAPLDVMVTASPFGYRISPITGPWANSTAARTTPPSAAPRARRGQRHRNLYRLAPLRGGNRVVIDHGNGLETTYNHLSSSNVRVGQQVSRGDVVAMSGTTGASTGCHLHFEVMVNGEVVDPLGWL